MISLNTQAIEKVVDSRVLEVNSVFSTIQGEGPDAGTPAIFVRMAGCTLNCPKCDTEYTEREQMVTEALVNKVLMENASRFNDYKPLIVFTGGEPLRQRIDRPIYELIQRGYRVQIETNGTCMMHSAMGLWSTGKLSIVCSPKTPVVHSDLQPWINSYKYVISGHPEATDKRDGLPKAVLGRENRNSIVFRPNDLRKLAEEGRIFVQPEDTRNEALNKINMDKCVEVACRFNYRISIQTHKLMGVA